jgi:HK97 family phage major capsid protein
LLDDPRRGFASVGHYARAVIQAARNPRAALDERLKIIAAAPTTFGGENVGADGGFAVPPQFAQDVLTFILAGDSLIPLCDQQLTETNAQSFPSDQSTPWGSSGVTAAWSNEAVAATQNKPALSNEVLRLNKLIAFVPLSDELVADAAGLATYLPKKAADAISWKANHAILQGNGNGQPLGILGAAATVVQAKDTSQATSTISITNASNMFQRMPPGSHVRAVFVCNEGVLGGLLSLGTTGAGYGMSWEGDYIPGTRVPMVGRLLGRPVIPMAHLPAFSSQGDLCMIDFGYYRVLTRGGLGLAGIENAWSFHMFFDAAAAAFRATFRMDGAPTIKAALSPPQGSTTLSPFVQLASR